MSTRIGNFLFHYSFIKPWIYFSFCCCCCDSPLIQCAVTFFRFHIFMSKFIRWSSSSPLLHLVSVFLFFICLAIPFHVTGPQTNKNRKNKFVLAIEFSHFHFINMKMLCCCCCWMKWKIISEIRSCCLRNFCFFFPNTFVSDQLDDPHFDYAS